MDDQEKMLEMLEEVKNALSPLVFDTEDETKTPEFSKKILTEEEVKLLEQTWDNVVKVWEGVEECQSKSRSEMELKNVKASQEAK